ncbi:hypothetical protein K469DRAFT_753758 [Zopfia rhizophila CBS 207.26]|uniref:Uncharacterized protein n=1 Tax=Zopfia rhizophila CBS 207.26 TaxID=1314779 RepID=A0A6A6DK52_9PEZI|nr:hypothetical protein K469DRAFT_753758 [Zopfia rhizophila CBS 207.26]
MSGSGSVKRDKGYTALHRLAMWGDVWSGHRFHHRSEELDVEAITECFALMLKTGARVHHINGRGNTALHHASDAVAVRLLLDAGDDTNAVNNAIGTDKNGNGAFLHAVGIKNIGECGQRLSERQHALGANLNLRNHHG